MNAIGNMSDSDAPRVRKGARGAAAQIGEIIDVAELIRIVWSRKFLVSAIVVACLGLGVAAVNWLPKQYRALAELTLEPRQQRIVDLETLIGGVPPDTSIINTELALLSSRHLLGRLVDQENLMADPAFNPALTPADEGGGLLGLLGLGGEASEPPVEIPPDRQRELTISAVASTLSVSNPGVSLTLRIGFETEDPEKSARLANALADLYLADQLEAKFEVSERAAQWLGNRISDLREQVREAERAVQEFRDQNAIVSASGDGTIREQQLAQLNTRLVEAETEFAAAQARYSRVKEMVAQGSAVALGDVLNSALIQQLRGQEASIQQRYADLVNRYGDRHPSIAAVRAELGDVRAKINQEVGKIVTSIENELQVARSRVAALQTSMEGLTKDSQKVDAARVRLRELEREADSSRILLESFLSRYKEALDREELQKPDARIISRAVPPSSPSSPPKVPILAASLFLGGFLGLGSAFLLHLLERGYKTLDQIRRETGLTDLGLIPRLSRRRLRGVTPARYALENPNSAYAEALNAAYIALIFGQVQVPRTIVITSSMAGEGKTTVGLSLARVIARGGSNRVLLIDADFRNSNVWQRLDTERPQGRSVRDYLIGATPSWQDCIVTDPLCRGLDLLTALREPQNASILLHSERMEQLIRETRKAYDLVLIDTAPLLAVADAVFLGRMADTTALLVKGTTPRRAVRTAISSLDKAGVAIGGVIMTQVDLRRQAAYQYYGYGDGYIREAEPGT